MKPRVLWYAVALALLVMGGGWLMLRRGETTPAIRGEKLARELGCFACHGPGGLGGVADPTSPGGEVPDWRYTTVKLFITCEEDVRGWILHGSTAGDARRAPTDAHPSLVPMPAYAELLSPRETDDLVAYFLAVSGWRPEYSEEVYEGWKIATRLGCFGCHGPSGMGGVPNPGSLKGHIPPWDGEEFAELVRDEDELREWILFGRIERLWSDPAARLFLERQKTPMPAYHDYLSDIELKKLVAYILSLRSGIQEGGTDPEAAEVIGTVSVPRWRGR